MAEGHSFDGETVDVCVVGSGAGGGPVAHALAAAGASVVVLEKGPWYKASDFNHDEIENARRDMWVPLVEDEPHLESVDGGPFRKTNNGWIAHCVGGGTVHMSGYFYRLHPEDFALAERYGSVEGANLADWPIRYGDLAPYYDLVERVVGVSGADGTHPFEPPRSGPFPLPPVNTNRLASLVEAGAKKVGAHPFQIPRGVLSRPHRGRRACVYCDYCGSYGCESGAKSSTLASLIPEAVATGRCEVRTGCMAFEVGVDQQGNATGVRYFDENGNTHEQKAKMVCLAASSIESARLLLNSKSARFPAGLANSNGLVGKNLTFSTLAKGYGEFERTSLPELLRPTPVSHFLDRAVQDYYFLSDNKEAFDKGGTIHFILPHRNAIFTAERLARRANPPLWGTALSQELVRYYSKVHQIEFEVFGEFLSSEGTYVSTDEGLVDKWKIPVARIHLQRHPKSVENVHVLAERGIDILKAAGAHDTWTESVGSTTYVLQHGTCRFGSDPEHSVLDSACRSHEVKNLFVTDGSFMPTSGGVPTTLTILANAFRSAEHMVRQLRGDA
ncbi:MAG: GMC family oxidoreductase [Myxococcota bacterium]